MSSLLVSFGARHQMGTATARISFILFISCQISAVAAPPPPSDRPMTPKVGARKGEVMSGYDSECFVNLTCILNMPDKKYFMETYSFPPSPFSSSTRSTGKGIGSVSLSPSPLPRSFWRSRGGGDDPLPSFLPSVLDRPPMTTNDDLDRSRR